MDKNPKLPYEESAEYLTNIKGWVCKVCKRYFGENEHLARFCCATDMPCDCGNRKEKHYSMCSSCRNKLADEKYLNREAKVWDGVKMIYSEATDKYFFDVDSILEYLYDCEEYEEYEECENFTKLIQKQAIDLKLVICEPVKKPYFDMQEFLEDALPEDYDLDCDDINRIVNKWIEDQGTLAWYPGKYRLLVE